MEQHSVAGIPLQLARNCIVASIQVDLSDAVLAKFQHDLLELLQRSAAAGVILDVSGIEILDLEEFAALKQTASMAQLMGAKTIFSGFRAGVVSALVELDADTEGITAAFDLDAAFEALERANAEPRDDEEEAPDTEDSAGDGDVGVNAGG